MKYVIVRCEDLVREHPDVASLLEGAKTAHLQHLSQAGAAGLVRPRTPDRIVDRFQLHRGLFGLSLQDPAAAPAHCYAISANVNPGDGATAWCCELVTHHDGRIIDPTAGRIPTKESRVLLQALNEQLGSDHRRWETGDASHHLLIVRDPALQSNSHTAVRSPDLIVGQSWNDHLPKGPVREPLQQLIEQASKILENHAVNRVRVDLGENPANMVWFWGAAGGGAGKSFSERTGLTGSVISTGFPMRGFAQALGLRWHEGPKTFEEAAIQRLTKTATGLLAQHDVLYVHLQVDSTDPVERLCAMERIDQHLLKPLTETLSAAGSWRLLTVIDDRSGLAPFVAIGTGVPNQPAAKLSTEALAETGLAFADGAALYTWFTADA